MDGDWYARGMYEEGNKHYQYHLEHYGHPSEFGYKDIIPLWKAEKWDPDRLMAISTEKRAGQVFRQHGFAPRQFLPVEFQAAQVERGQHGPQRDVVGDWQKAAQKYGLRFGVSEHLGASFTWFQSSHRRTRPVPKAGVPYDGADPQYQDLYHFPANRATTSGTATIPAGNSSGTTKSRNWWIITIPTCFIPTAGWRLAKTIRSA